MVVQSINLVADLRNQNKNIGVLYIATGLVTEGDNNGGVFWWNPSSTAADDGVDVIQVTGTATGRWVRITDNNNSVPSSRELTINGTTYDLSANRTWSVGTVTGVSALTIGTSGTDLSSTVATGTTTPVITLNVPTASATNRGALSSADWTTFNSKQNAITLTTTGSSGASTFISNILNVPTYTITGLGGVPTSRTLTINGTVFDLSADRSWSVGTVTGTGASGQVTYWSGASSELGSNNLFWDAVNNRLGIGLVNPQRALEVYSATPDSHLRLSGSAPSVSLGDSIIGGLYQAKFGLATANGQYASASVAGDFVILSQTGATIFMTSATEKMRITAAGRMLLGLTTESTYLLDVNGTSRISGVVTLSNLAGTGSRIVVADANGVLSASSALSSYVTGSGTTNILPKWTSSSALGNSLLDDDGTSASVALALGGAFNIKYLSAIKLALTGGTTFGSIDVPIGLDFLIRPDSIEKLKLSSTGLLRLAQYGTGAVIGTPTYRLATDASGNIIEVTDGGGTVTSVGLSMPSAFAVTNSPVTGAGTLTVTGAGLATQYIRGDGQLATFPSTANGGSSVNYYLNGSVASSVAGYQQMDNNAIVGGGTDFTLVGNGLIAQFLTDAGNPNRIQIPGGAWNFEMYFQVSSAGGNQKFYIELHKYDGSTFTLIASSSAVPEEITGGTSIDLYLTSLAVPTTTLLTTDRLAIRVYIVDNAVGRTITLHTENTTLCEIITTFSGGVSSLNGLSANTQYLATGTSGTDFSINSVTDTHTFNLPIASGTNTGKLSNTDWTTFNSKQNAITLTTTGTSGASTLVGSTLNIPQYADQFVGTVTSVSALTLGTTGTDLSSTVANGTTTPVITLNVPTASATNRGALSSADWTTFNNKQNTITNPVTGTGTTNYIPKWTSGSAIGNSQVFDNGTNVGIGTLIPTAKLQVEGDGIVINTEGAAAAKYLYFRYSDGVDIQSDSYLKFSTSISPTERMRITSSGNLLVGTTTDAGEKLQVNGSGKFSSSVTAGGKGIFETNTTVGNDGTYTSYASVGLGGTTDGFNRVFGGVGTADGLFLASATGRGIFFRAGGGTTEHVSITSGGNLLVGTTIDTGEKLQVNGSGKFSSSVTATSFIKSGGTSSQYLMADGSVTTSGGGGSVDELQVALLSQVYG